MNIEKIKNYNQKMLALLSTILVVLAAIGLISLIVMLIDEIIPNRSSGDMLFSDIKTDKLNTDSLRQQIFSFSTPLLIDTTNRIYIIQVDVKTLSRPESKYKSDEVYYEEAVAESIEYTSYSERFFYGSFINLLEYDYNTGSVKKICDQRIVGNGLTVKKFDDETILVFKGSTKDTDGNGLISEYDFNSLFVYSLKEKKLHNIDYKNATLLTFESIDRSKDMFLSFGIDRNNDNFYDSDSEPEILVKYDYKQGAISKIIDKTTESEIQKLIENN